MAFLAAAAGIGSSLIGGLFAKKAATSGAQQSAKGQIDTNKTNLQIARETNAANTANANSAQAFNVQQAQQQQAFQANMANTAHQREVADLKAAGLNPILSGTGGSGASVPSGTAADAVVPNLVTPTVSNPMSEFANSGRSIANAYQSAASDIGKALMNLPMYREQVNQAKLNNDYTRSQISALDASSARDRAIAPIYEKGGNIVRKVADAVTSGKPAYDVPGKYPMVKKAVEWINSDPLHQLYDAIVSGGASAASNLRIPSSAKRLWDSTASWGTTGGYHTISPPKDQTRTSNAPTPVPAVKYRRYNGKTGTYDYSDTPF